MTAQQAAALVVAVTGHRPHRLRHAQTERLAAADPSNMFWFGSLCQARLRWAEVQLLRGGALAARDAVRRVLADRRTLLERDPSRVDWQVLMSGTALELAARTGVLPGDVLRDELAAYADTLRRLAAAGTVLDRDQAYRAAAARYQLGLLLAADGRPDAAAAHWRAAAEGLPVNPASRDHAAQMLLLRVQRALGDEAGAQALLARLQDSPFRHPELDGLARQAAQRAGPAAAIPTTRRTP